MKTQKYGNQMPFSGNDTQFTLMRRANESRAIESQAEVVRAGLNLLFGLDPMEEVPDGVDADALVARAVRIVADWKNHKIVRKGPEDYTYDEADEARPADTAPVKEPAPVV